MFKRRKDIVKALGLEQKINVEAAALAKEFNEMRMLSFSSGYTNNTLPPTAIAVGFMLGSSAFKKGVAKIRGNEEFANAFYNQLRLDVGEVEADSALYIIKNSQKANVTAKLAPAGQ